MTPWALAHLRELQGGMPNEWLSEFILRHSKCSRHEVATSVQGNWQPHEPAAAIRQQTVGGTWFPVVPYCPALSSLVLRVPHPLPYLRADQGGEEGMGQDAHSNTVWCITVQNWECPMALRKGGVKGPQEAFLAMNVFQQLEENSISMELWFRTWRLL